MEDCRRLYFLDDLCFKHRSRLHHLGTNELWYCWNRTEDYCKHIPLQLHLELWISYNSYIEITYSGGTDADAPVSSFVPYTGITSFVEGARTFFTTLTDLSGIDTTTANAPTLNYALNNGSFTQRDRNEHWNMQFDFL